MRSRKLSLDLETYSPIDIRKAGVYRYAEDVEVLMCAFAWDNEPVQIIDIASGEALPEDVVDHIKSEKPCFAFNANFERVVLSKHFGLPTGRYLSAKNWHCTAVLAATAGLPGSLDQASRALGLEQKKDKNGMALIRYFSMPCKPTKTNGGRERNLPHHDPEKWQLFRSYCIQDVVVEREIHRALEHIEVLPEERRLYVLDQEIIDRGVLVDMKLVNNAIRIDADIKAALTVEAVALTGLQNPNAIGQLKGWLEEEAGEEMEEVTKASVAELLPKAEGPLRRMLEIRQELGKSSTTKYSAIARSVCSDSRVRGTLKFYGAGRTGRWAGQLLQVQNLPSNKLKDLDLARRLLIDGDVEYMEMFYGNVPGVLSELIRTAIVAPKGQTFTVVDFSAIEARMLAWMAGEEWRLEIFRTHGKIYEASASEMFGVPIDQVDKSLRQKGKVAELACFGADTQVITSKGIKRIVDITPVDFVWDGASWTQTEGVICKGPKHVVNLAGVEVTPDHLIRTGQTWMPAQQLVLNESTLSLALATATESLLFSGLNLSKAELVRRRWLKFSALVAPSRITSMFTTFVKGLRLGVTSVQKNKQGSGEKSGFVMPRYAQTMLIAGGFSTGSQPRLHAATALPQNNIPLTAVEGFTYTHLGGKIKAPFSLTLSRFRGGMTRPMIWIASTLTKVMNPAIFGSFLRGKIEAGTSEQSQVYSSRSSSLKPVFDILNSGSRNTFTILTDRGPLLVHNCGYGGGPNALITMGALKMGVPESELKGLIDAWRKANPNIKKLWYDTENAAKKAIRKPRTKHTAGKCSFFRDGMWLYATLPSGRKLCYYNPRLVDGKYGEQIEFDGIDGVRKTFGPINTHGGKLIENLTQAACRDLLRDSLLAMEAAGLRTVMHVHDEIIVEGKACLEEAEQIMGLDSTWAPGLPLRGDGYVTEYYRKDN